MLLRLMASIVIRKCISLVLKEMVDIIRAPNRYAGIDSHNFPFKGTADDSEFVRICSNNQKHGSHISDLLYNPYDSNSE